MRVNTAALSAEREFFLLPFRSFTTFGLQDPQDLTGRVPKHCRGTSINDMKDMLASLPQMREVKEKVRRTPLINEREAFLICYDSDLYPLLDR